MVKIPENIFKSYDIRGIYPDEINEKNIYQIVQGILSFLVEKHPKNQDFKVVTGRDMRLSSPVLYPVLRKALLDGGISVVDIGLASTPTFYFAVFHYNFDAGIQLSASHNPPQYNGLKIVKNSPGGLIKIGASTGMETIKKYTLEGRTVRLKKRGNLLTKKVTLSEEIKNAKTMIEELKIKKLTVVADAANAMGALYINALFKDLPCKLIRLNFKLDGSFPVHQPDPLVKENLKDLQKKILQEKADFGMAPDGDGDRLFFVDEKANIVPASAVTVIVAGELLKKYPNSTILYDIRYTNNAKKAIEEYGGKPMATKVGHAFITDAMNKTGAIFAGESSGHYFFKKTGNAESQLPVILTILKVISKEERPFSKIVESVSRSFESGEFNFETDRATKIISSLKKHYSSGKLITIDGLVVEYRNWRFSVRKSNTEPLMRLNVEADSKKLLKKRLEELLRFIKKIGAKLK